MEKFDIKAFCEGYLQAIYEQGANNMMEEILAMASPKVIDLTQFTDENTGYTINDLALGLMMESLQNNGAMQELYVADSDSKLRKALATNRAVYIQTLTPNGIAPKFPAVHSSRGDSPAQISFNCLLYLDDIIFELNANIVFSNDPTQGNFDMYVKATPVWQKQS